MYKCLGRMHKGRVTVQNAVESFISYAVFFVGKLCYLSLETNRSSCNLRIIELRDASLE